jgi:hypothetical protein
VKTSNAVISSLLALTQSVWMVGDAQAQHGREKNKPEKRQGQGEHERSNGQDAGRERGLRQQDAVPIGEYFQEHHRSAAHEYYGRPENRGFCPPGLAKKNNGCLPPGHSRQWQKGYPLARGVVFYEVPRSVVLTLGVPPSGRVGVASLSTTWVAMSYPGFQGRSISPTMTKWAGTLLAIV